VSNSDGQTPYQLAKEPEVAQLLQVRRAARDKTDYEGSDDEGDD
jgi:hypothetical protein